MTQTKGFAKKLTEIAQEGFDASAAESQQEIDSAPGEPREETIPKSQIDSYINEKFEAREQALEEKYRKITAATAQTVEQPSPKKVEAIDDLPEFKNWEERDRIYVLCTGFSSLTHGIRDRHKKNSDLMYKGRSLRYSTSQASFFMDKQVGETLICYLQIENGKLFVPKENAHLQKFLAIHPDNGIHFKEHNPQLESKLAYEVQNLKLDAHLLSRQVDTASLEAIAMMMCKDYLETWDVYTLKKQLYLEIEADPKLFIKFANDKSLKLKSLGKQAVIRGLLRYENFRFSDEQGTILCESSRNENEYDALALYFSSNEGRNLYEYLVHKIEQ